MVTKHICIDLGIKQLKIAAHYCYNYALISTIHSSVLWCSWLVTACVCKPVK